MDSAKWKWHKKYHIKINFIQSVKDLPGSIDQSGSGQRKKDGFLSDMAFKALNFDYTTVGFSSIDARNRQQKI